MKTTSKVNWLALENHVRDVLADKSIDDATSRMLIAILIGQATGRGYSIADDLMDDAFASLVAKYPSLIGDDV